MLITSVLHELFSYFKALNRGFLGRYIFWNDFQKHSIRPNLHKSKMAAKIGRKMPEITYVNRFFHCIQNNINLISCCHISKRPSKPVV